MEIYLLKMAEFGNINIHEINIHGIQTKEIGDTYKTYFYIFGHLITYLFRFKENAFQILITIYLSIKPYSG